VTTVGRALIKTGQPRDVIAVLETVRRDNPAEPFFSGLVEMNQVPSGVELEFAASQRPVLLPVVSVSGAAPASVACHLYS